MLLRVCPRSCRPVGRRSVPCFNETIRIYQWIYQMFICATFQRSPSTLPTLCGALAKWAMEARRLHGTSSDECWTLLNYVDNAIFPCYFNANCFFLWGVPRGQRLYRDVIKLSHSCDAQCRWEGHRSAAGTNPEGALVSVFELFLVISKPLQASSFYTGKWHVQECEIPVVKTDLSVSLSLYI